MFSPTSCTSCTGFGKIRCWQCNGTGSNSGGNCYACHQGNVDCSSCGGTGLPPSGPGPNLGPDPFKTDPFKTDPFKTDPFKTGPVRTDPGPGILSKLLKRWQKSRFNNRKFFIKFLCYYLGSMSIFMIDPFGMLSALIHPIPLLHGLIVLIYSPILLIIYLIQMILN